MGNNRRLMDFFDLKHGSKVTFFTPHGGFCATVAHPSQETIKILYGSKTHRIDSLKNLSPLSIKKDVSMNTFTYEGQVPDMRLEFHGPGDGIYEMRNKNKRFVEVPESKTLSGLIKKYGPAHFHVVSCRFHRYSTTTPSTGHNRRIQTLAHAYNRFSGRSLNLDQMAHMFDMNGEQRAVVNRLKQGLFKTLLNQIARAEATRVTNGGQRARLTPRLPGNVVTRVKGAAKTAAVKASKKRKMSQENTMGSSLKRLIARLDERAEKLKRIHTPYSRPSNIRRVTDQLTSPGTSRSIYSNTAGLIRATRKMEAKSVFSLH
tara:strand:- start:2399 stop:3349 length:951 start_codon:yes stop_codon:yes gene_type:complete